LEFEVWILEFALPGRSAATFTARAGRPARSSTDYRIAAGSGVSTAASDGVGSQVQQQPLASAGSGVSAAASDGVGPQVQQQPLASAGSGVQQGAAAPLAWRTASLICSPLVTSSILVSPFHLYI